MNRVRLAWAIRSGKGVQSGGIPAIMSRGTRKPISRALRLDHPELRVIDDGGRRDAFGLARREGREQLLGGPAVLRGAAGMQRLRDGEVRRHPAQRRTYVERG